MRWLSVLSLVLVCLSCGSNKDNDVQLDFSDLDTSDVASDGTMDQSMADLSVDTEDTDTVDLGCEGTDSTAELDDTYRIVRDIEYHLDHLHFASAMMEGLGMQIQKVPWLFINTNPIPAPPPMFRGPESYLIEPTSPEGVIDVRLYYGDDYDVGKYGEEITYDILAMESYFTGLTIDDSNLPELTIDWGANGPLIELLGYGPNPPKPLRVDEARDLFWQLDKVLIQATVSSAGERDVSETVLMAHTPLMPLSEVFHPASWVWELDLLESSRPELNQVMTLELFDITYVSPERPTDYDGLIGRVEMTVDGDHFPYHATIDYGTEPFIVPEYIYQCLERP